MKNIFYLFFIALFISSCSNKNDRGELVGVKGTKFFPDKPSGMILVPSGSFLMGMADDDVAGLQNAPVSTVSVKAFYMDETEITNGEYRQFVNWVRDSVVRENLARKAIAYFKELPSEDSLKVGIGQYYPKFLPIEEGQESEYQKYLKSIDKGTSDLDELSDKSDFSLDWDRADIIWDREEYPSLHMLKLLKGLDSLQLKNALKLLKKKLMIL